MPVGGSLLDFGKLIADETEKWAKVIKFAGIKLESRESAGGCSICLDTRFRRADMCSA
jgi:hypothetical protein